MIRFIFIFLFFWVSGIFISCKNLQIHQHNRKSVNDTADFPYWISMIDSPNVNYYQAVRAFELYWKNREIPVENDGEGKDIFNKDAKEKDQKSVQYAYEYKRFFKLATAQ